MHKGLLIVLSGPSGTGKGTVLKKLMEMYPNISYSVSVTTRKKREGEVDGRDYFFKTYEEFKHMLHNNEFLETAEVYGNYYGTPVKNVEALRRKGRDVLLEIDTVGAANIKKKFKDAVLIFMVPPAMSELSDRLVMRNSETDADMKLRRNAAESEIACIDGYDYVVVNNVPEQAAEDMYCIIKGCRLSVKNNKDIIKNLIGGNQK